MYICLRDKLVRVRGMFVFAVAVGLLVGQGGSVLDWYYYFITMLCKPHRALLRCEDSTMITVLWLTPRYVIFCGSVRAPAALRASGRVK